MNTGPELTFVRACLSVGSPDRCPRYDNAGSPTVVTNRDVCPGTAVLNQTLSQNDSTTPVMLYHINSSPVKTNGHKLLRNYCLKVPISIPVRHVYINLSVMH